MKDKVVVITGGAKGLGKQMAGDLKALGAQVVIADIDSGALREVGDELGVLDLTVDVTAEDQMETLVSKVVQEFGRVDVWINNAAVWLPRCPVEDLNIERVRKMFDVNVSGTILGSIYALRQMKKQGYGTILNIISVSALMGRPLSAGYSASKYAVRGFTDSLRAENEGGPIKILAAYPGGIQTNLFDEGQPDDFDEYMPVSLVSEKIINNLQEDQPELDLLVVKSEKEAEIRALLSS